MSYVCPDLGYKAESSIAQLFASIPTLQHISVAGEAFDRQTWSAVNGTPSGIRRYDDMQRVMSASTRLLSKGRQTTWQFTTDTWKRTDLGGLGKTWRIAAGLTGTLTMGAAHAASKGARGLASLIGGAIADYRHSMNKASRHK